MCPLKPWGAVNVLPHSGHLNFFCCDLWFFVCFINERRRGANAHYALNELPRHSLGKDSLYYPGRKDSAAAPAYSTAHGAAAGRYSRRPDGIMESCEIRSSRWMPWYKSDETVYRARAVQWFTSAGDKIRRIEEIVAHVAE